MGGGRGRIFSPGPVKIADQQANTILATRIRVHGKAQNGEEATHTGLSQAF
jgi:hypothetical protein